MLSHLPSLPPGHQVIPASVYLLRYLRKIVFRKNLREPMHKCPASNLKVELTHGTNIRNDSVSVI